MAKLQLSVPDHKAVIKNLDCGVDILGVVAFPYGLVPRRRISRAALKVAGNAAKIGYTNYIGKQLSSYIGLLSNSKSYLLKQRLRVSINNQSI